MSYQDKPSVGSLVSAQQDQQKQDSGGAGGLGGSANASSAATAGGGRGAGAAQRLSQQHQQSQQHQLLRAAPLRCNVLKALVRAALAHDNAGGGSAAAAAAAPTPLIFTFAAGSTAAAAGAAAAQQKQTRSGGAATPGGATEAGPAAASAKAATAVPRRLPPVVWLLNSNPFIRVAETLRAALYEPSDRCPICFHLNPNLQLAGEEAAGSPSPSRRSAPATPPPSAASKAAGSDAAAGDKLPRRRVDPALASQRPPSRQLRPCPPWDPDAELCLEVFENEWRHGSLAVGVAPLLALGGGEPAALSAAFAAAAAESAASGITQASQARYKNQKQAENQVGLCLSIIECFTREISLP